MPLIKFPNIPAMPGVPQLPRLPGAVESLAKVGAGAVLSKLKLGALQGAIMRALGAGAKWGVYDSTGKALADPATITGLAGNLLDSFGIGAMQSTLNVDYSKETRISDFPVEGGQFASYNKVIAPGVANVTLAVSGNVQARSKFLVEIAKATLSRDLYSVITPEGQYVNYNVERYDYSRRAEGGAGLLIVNLTLRQVRQVTATYASVLITNPAEPGASPAADGGAVQPKAPAQSVLKSAVQKFGSFIK